MQIVKLSIGDFIWTIDENGTKKKARIVKNIKQKAHKVYFVARITLYDRRTISASPPHPTTDYRDFENLRMGQSA